MTPAELKQARHSLGLSLSQMARMLGYDGTHGAQQVRRMESGERAIRGAQVRLLEAYVDGYRPDDWPVREPWDTYDSILAVADTAPPHSGGY